MFLRRNTASQTFTIPGSLRAISDGSAVTSAASIFLNGSGTAGGGTLTHWRAGAWRYTPTQAETDVPIMEYALEATGAVTLCGSVRTTAGDPNDGVRLGLTSLPNAAASASGGLPTVGTGTGQITLAAGVVTASIGTGGITSASFAAATGLAPIASGTAQAGAASTITLAAGESSVTNWFVDCFIRTTGGTGAGQIRVVTAYNGTTKVATVDQAWGTNPDATTTYAITGNASSSSDVRIFGGTAGAFAAGRPEVNMTHIAGAAVAAGTAQLGVNVVNWGGTAVASALVRGNVIQMNGVALSTTTAQIGVNVVQVNAQTATASAGVNFSNLDAAITTRATDAGVWAAANRTLTAGTNIVLAKGTGVTGFNDIDAAGVRSAVGLASANLDTQLTTIDTVVDSILDDTGTAGVVVASASKTGYELASTGLDPVVIETGLNARQAVAVVAAACGGVLSGAGTATEVIRGAGVGTTRITATVDADGNRTAITLSPPA